MKISLENWKRPAFIMAMGVACVTHAQTPAVAPAPVSTNSYPPLTLSAPASFWKDGIGNGFQKGAQEVGIGFGYAPGVILFGSTVNHSLLMGTAHAGWMISDVVLKDHPLRGNWEALAEVFGGTQVTPRAYLTGLDLFMRYNFITGTRVVPYFQGGLGALATDIGRPDLGSVFEFNEKAGIGAQIFITEKLAASVECRFMHISNAGIHNPNLGVNVVPFYVGLSYFF